MSKYSLETLAVHRSIPEKSGSVQTPIHQTSSFVFESTEHAAKLFALEEFGSIYSRLTNPTVDEYASRLASLHGAAGGFACSSGHAAQFLILLNLLQSGDHIVASKYLYGGSVTQLTHTFPRQFGWQSTLVDINKLDEVRNAIQDNTKVLYIESQSNPSGVIADIKALAEIAHEAGIPLIVDNTVATPYLINPLEHGADIVSYSLTKYLSGNGSIVGGAVIDSGKFDWAANDKFPLLSKPDSSYSNISFAKSFGNLAFTVRGIAVGLRDIGATLSPHTAFLAIQGLETLGARLDRHVKNAEIVAKFLNAHPKVKKVNYAGLVNSPYNLLASKYFTKGVVGLLTIELEGGFEAGKNLVEQTKLFTHCANIGDARSLIIHPASTTHSQLSEEEKSQSGISNGLVRLSVGLEDPSDLIEDLKQALEYVEVRDESESEKVI
ncbi:MULTISPECIES: O-acetylhomoserine aminocarboxypropyltransferase/cysteine synthase family protein [unclassified Francisella]|uniref:O-acetylhomoserine aminocarboxypropyltransferase/cysteine synthase family protein n=1 Tax=unclassified Francisella TaxID=2610885 RepID=UPI002E319A9D|nr:MULTISPECIES: O-acetylhomoserine aminocarboxypropyltransferase/cysteine synthase family protein [unclassified Francisella]MED7819728.1 O-acetylhomoserine aminocarboxypropyltransferase/cysteine synthase family protein [Francisella sp. 19S2-4]MED7830553.1 O-acetylhomoserine aminocarboxypropyltransferase/cysteine synthase family protein [Francisella sp. 19S2-10]